VGTKQNSIVLNGKLYDARTGALIHAPTVAAQPTPKIHKNKGLVMDGIVRKTAKAKPAARPRSVHSPQHAQRHKPQKAATLMRQTVSKPVHRAHQNPEPTTIHDHRTQQRLERAQAVHKSNHIHRFPADHAPQRPVTKKRAAVPVEAPPTPARHTATATAHTAAPISASEKLVTNALKNARAHEANHPFAKKPKKRISHALGFRRKTGNLALGSLAVLVLVGFFVYQNVPNLSMRVASTRAGFSANQPGYTPSGFSQDKLVSYSPGKVTISFHSNSDDRGFQMSQKVSNWNSQSLADNYLAVKNKQYQTYQAGGKTIYVYDGANATWVNGGVWYQIEGKSSLTSDQLLKIANSI